MILADTSAWVEYWRASGHPAHLTLRSHFERGVTVAISEIVVMELLAGLRTERTRKRLRSNLLSLPVLRLQGLDDFEHAAQLYRDCRAKGDTVRKMMDCLLAAVAIREGVPLLHNDRDFEVLSRHTALGLADYVD